MLSRKYRLRRRNDFSRLYRRGRTAHSRSFSLKYDHNRQGHPRIGVVVSTKVSKKAVVRNRLRRQIYAQMRDILPELATGYDVIVLVRASAIGQNGNDLGQELRQALSKAELLKN